MSKRLYLVQHDDDLGYRVDLVVSAPCPAGAAQLWRDYYDLTLDVDPDNVWELTAPFGHGPLAWKSDHCKEVTP